MVFLHHMLSKAAVKARPSVLWCYKKELGFSRYADLYRRLYASLSCMCAVTFFDVVEALN